MAEKFDVVIVGAGMGGGILAARIAEHGVNPRTGEKLRIALMDMGPYLKGDPRPGYGIASRRAAYANMPGVDDTNFVASTPWGTSAGIGGQSLHWGANADLPDEEYHDDWIQETGVNWSYDRLTDARTEIIEMFHIGPDPEEILAPGSLKFRDVATQMGYRVRRAERCVLNCIQCGHCAEVGCKYDAKSGTLVRYIPIAERHGVEIMPFTTVQKVLIEKQGAAAVAKGVVYTRGGKTEEALADKVMVCCNSQGTPVLLYKSGYGPRDKVKDLIVENPNVGKHATVPLLNSVWAVFDEPVKRVDLGANSRYQFELRGPQGYLNIRVGELFGFHGFIGNYLYQMALNDIAPDFGKEHKRYMKRWLHFGGLNTEVGRQRYVTGEVSPTGQFVINRNHPAIVQRSQEAREIARDVLLRMGARKTTDISKPFEVGTVPAATGNGTCRAGADRSNSVINSDFESHDVENLFICDTSVIPANEGGGVPAAYLACHAWRRIVANHFKRA